MTRPTSRLAALSVAAAVLFATTGCEDTPVTAGEGWTIDVIAEPPSVPDEGEAQVEITALVANDVGIPQSGVTVVFSTEGGGVLASGAGTNL